MEQGMERHNLLIFCKWNGWNGITRARIREKKTSTNHIHGSRALYMPFHPFHAFHCLIISRLMAEMPFHTLFHAPFHRNPPNRPPK